MTEPDVGRSKTFVDTDVVLAARDVFWGSGYENTAVADLESATGLNRSSLYHSFGSKRGLFDAAVESYLDDVVRPRLAPLASPLVASDALENYIRGLRRAMVDEPSSLAANGCLLLNATGSPVGREAAVQDVVARYVAELRAGVTAGVATRRPDLDTPARELLTTTVTGLIFASMAIVRVDRHAAGATLDAALAAIAPVAD
ncbi:AcrR family transcriptional regulator [Conyzicola lurida]|uniref:AcrR family transcriptional regulator n=1 Tax=Conyzicola lurida TaxID=1172621 RepID=A0A841AQ61_9MICO|nr:TetR/AcrR family transcriptional regulator [Conyzicola lurida]MBB5843733.1 AcrR family transcriptional regulator [Conyzicola lurida]